MREKSLLRSRYTKLREEQGAVLHSLPATKEITNTVVVRFQ
jgi:hypothetical protein